METPVQSPRRHNSQLERYLTSSTVRRRKLKDRPCYYCEREENGEGFVHHLRRSRSCVRLYMRFLKVHSFETVLLKLFSCEMCGETRSVNFVKHLERNNRCLAGYREKYDLVDCSEIAKKMKAMKRMLYESRNAAVRKLETNKKKINEIQNKTAVSSLNDFRKNTIFFNYKHCVLCKSNFGGLSARELKPSEELYEQLDLDLEEKLKMRRFEKTFICSKCQNLGYNRTNEDTQKNVQLGEILLEEGTKIIFFPSEQETEERIIEQEKVMIMIPSTMEATRIWPETVLSKMKPNHEEVRKIYRSQNITNSQLKVIYDTEMSKFKANDNDIMYAVIRNDRTKTLADVIRPSSALRISGSNDWFSQRKKEIIARSEQYGNMFMTIEIDLPDSGSGIIATALINEGVVVTANQTGSSTGAVEIEYMVHPHDNSVDCSCNEEDLSDLKVYLETASFDISSLHKKHVGTIVSSAHQIFDSFVKDIIGAPGSNLFSNNYYFVLSFKENGQSTIIGCFWPRVLDAVNIDIASTSGKLCDKAAILKFLGQNLSVSSDARILRSTFNLSEREAENLSLKVWKNQYDLRVEPELPSLETSLKADCSYQNTKSASELRQYMKQNLKSLTDEDKTNMSTFDWLDGVLENITADLEDEQEYLTVTIENVTEHTFDIDERMVTLLDKFHENPLYAIYQYSLTCRDKSDFSMVVHKRLSIKDSYTKAFNPFILGACESSMNISLDNNPDNFDNFLSSSKQISGIEGVTRADLLLSHRLVNLSEALSLSDKTKRRIKASSPSQFVNAKPNRLAIVKKAVVPSPNNYKLDRSNDYFEVVPDYITRHFNKTNGNNLLVETCLWYQYIGQEESKKVFELYNERLDRVPDSEVKSVMGGFLPKFLLCTNGDVLQIRKRAQVLLFPQPKSEYEMMYQKCLLFSPIKHESELQESNLREKYLQRDDEQNEKVVTLNERKIFMFKLLNEDTYVSDEDENSHDHGEDVTVEDDDEEEVDGENIGGNEFALDQLLELL